MYVKKLLLFSMYAGTSLTLWGQGLTTDYDARSGLIGMSYNNFRLLDTRNKTGAAMTAENYRLRGKDGKFVTGWSHVVSRTIDHATKTTTFVYKWGKMNCVYQQTRDTLDLNFSITNNNGSDTLYGVSISPFTLVFPEAPVNFIPKLPYVANNVQVPAVITADCKRFSLVIESPEINRRSYVGLIQGADKGKISRIWIGSTPFNGMQDFDRSAEICLPPGATYRLRVRLKFLKPGADKEKVSAAIYTAFRKENPSLVQWNDRRPVASLFLSSYSPRKASSNKRNWMFGADMARISGGAAFKRELLSYAERALKIIRSVNAQGMITWDVEGQEYPHPISYIGSPELLPRLAPEMDEAVDAYFDVFRKAGLRTGICIRPDSVVFSSGSARHVVVKDPASTLINKIRYAQRRWGCSMFYIDSNVDSLARLMPASIFEKVARACPGVLLIPEHESKAYYRFSAPYEEMRSGIVTVDPEVKRIYPDASLVLNIADGLNVKAGEEKNIEILERALKDGVILLFRGWFFEEPQLNWLKKAMVKQKLLSAQ